MSTLFSSYVGTCKTLCLMSVTLVTLSACSSGPVIDEQVELPVDVLYNEALDLALANQPKKAAPKFEEVERQHPYSIWAVRSQIMAGWAFYAENDYERAVATLERFIELYPADPLTEYAYYLRALCFYEQIVDVERDADMTRRAMTAFEELVRRYPDGSYGRDAQLKADLTRSHLAGKEMAVARFYMEQGYFSAALKRYAIVVRDFDNTNQVPEALYRMVETYLSLGLADEAERVVQVSEYNYPDSVWTERAVEVLNNPERAGPRGLIGSVIDRALTIF